MTTSDLKADDPDRLFSEYLKGQVPNPWPACQVLSRLPEPAGRVATPRAGQARSRLVLAASVAGLLGLGLFLSNGTSPQPAPVPRPSTDPGLLDSATAKGRELEGKGSVTVEPERKRP